MILSSIEEIWQQAPEWSQHWTLFEQAESLAGKVCTALQLGLLFSRLLLEADLTQRAQVSHRWPECPQCGVACVRRDFDLGKGRHSLVSCGESVALAAAPLGAVDRYMSHWMRP